MTTIKEQAQQKTRESKVQAHADLIKTAVESIQYVAFGRVMKRDLMEKFGLTESAAEHILAVVSDDLVRKIKELKPSKD